MYGILKVEAILATFATVPKVMVGKALIALIKDWVTAGAPPVPSSIVMLRVAEETTEVNDFNLT